jgi:hypothetical protein
LGFHPSPSMKHHAFDFVGTAIAIRADIRRCSVPCGADASMIPRPGVECGLAFAVHSRRQASFRRTNTRFSKVDLDPLSESEAASFPNGPVMSSNSCEEKLSPPAKFPADGGIT